ncbi:pPIWI_RE_Y domain-containing protein [Kitasatospora sp. NPDC003701]
MDSEEFSAYRQLASVVAASSELGSLRSFALPYPPLAQRALDQMVLRCLDLGEEPPFSVPGLLEWCRRRPAGDRVFGLPAGLLDAKATLVHPVGLMPTRTCLEVTSHEQAAGVEQEARALLADLAGRCKDTEQYCRSRQFLAQRVVVHKRDRFDQGWSKAVWTRVRDLYQPLPESLVVSGKFLLCGTCRLPALLSGRRAPEHGAPVAGPQTWCEGEDCPPGEQMELIRDPEQVMLLRRPLRAFLALPFAVEQAGLASLGTPGVGYEVVPGELGSYRLRGPGLAVHSVHFYDRVQPVLLAGRSAELVGRLPGLAAVVVPERSAGSADFRRAFAVALPEELRARVLLSGPQGLAQQIHDHLIDEREDAHA